MIAARRQETAVRPSELIDRHRSALTALADRHRVANVRVFGSAAARTDGAASDLDLLVDPTDETTLLDLARFKREAEAALGVPVDVLTPEALSPRFRDAVVQSAKPL
jgi:predicted nucleotidyltransferase